MSDDPVLIAEGVTRQRNIKRRFWRVRHHPEGMFLLEVLGEYRRRPVWRMLAQDLTQEEAMKKFNEFARPLPPGLSLPSGIKAEPYTHPDRLREEEAAERKALLAEVAERKAQQAERQYRERLSGFDPGERRPN